MSDFEFVIPLSKEQLLEKQNANDYAVADVLFAKLLPTKLKHVTNEYRAQGTSVILSNFDYFYSVIEHFKTLDTEVSLAAWRLIMNVTKSLVGELVRVLDTDSIETDTRIRYGNMLKMSVYVVCQMMESYELSVSVILMSQNATKTSKKKASSNLVEQWECEREAGLHTLLSVVQLHISSLWDPPIVEEQFVKLVTNTCYKTLENIAGVKYKQCKEHIANIIGIMVKCHKHSFSCVLKLLQLLQNSEQMVSTVAYIVSVLCNQYDCPMVVTEIMREIGRLDSDELAQDTINTRNMAALLVEMSKLTPLPLLQSISLVIELLDEESYTMRNGMVVVLGELLKGVLRQGLDQRLKTTKHSFFSLLEGHIQDVNAFVRSRVLQVWHMLITEKVVPLLTLNHVMALVAERVRDRSSSVRKAAIQVLIGLIMSNKIATKFTAEEFGEHFKKEQEKLEGMKAEREKRRSEEGNKDKEENGVEGDEGEGGGEKDALDELIEGRKESTNDEFNSMLGKMSIGQGDGEEEEEEEEDDAFVKQKALVGFLKSSGDFVLEVDKSMQTIAQLFSSKVSSDVIEAINFFYTGYKEGVEACMIGIRKMLPLACSKEKDIKAAVVQAYKGVYLEPKSANGDARPTSVSIAESLTVLALSCNTFGQLISLDALIQEFVTCGSITDGVIKVLWQKFTFSGSSGKEKKVALMLIRFIASSKVEIIFDNIDIIIDTALPPSHSDPLLAAEALVTLSMLDTIRKSNEESPFQLPNDHKLFGLVTTMMVEGMQQLDNMNWIPMSHQAVVAIYKLAQGPDRICESIIRSQVKVILGAAGFADNDDEIKQLLNGVDGADDDGDQLCDATQTIGGTQQSNTQQIWATQKSTQQASQSQHVILAPLLTRFLYTVGNVALQQLVYLDLFVYNELKRIKWLNSKTDSSTAPKQRKSLSAFKVKTASRSKRDDQNSTSNSTVASENHGDQEENWAEDVEAEAVFRVTEKELLYGQDSLLASLKPIVVAVCSNQVKYNDPDLSVASTSALCKFMILSSEFCQCHIRLLFTLLERSNFPLVRITILNSLADLVQRFPNLIEPWTPNIYRRLRDDSSEVRLNAVLILTRLILNDMIKVKGQISDLTLSILDDDVRIASAAKVFFTEFSNKPNSIYNVLPDIISRLSEETTNQEHDHFKPIMKFLIAFIEKDKQCENLIEKFCHRIRATDKQKHCQDLCYCISLLPFNEKCIQKLMENSSCYYDRLTDDVVVQCFQTVVTNAKKSIKLDSKTCVGDFETWLNEQVDRLRATKGSHDNHNNDKHHHHDDVEDEEEALIGTFVASNQRTSLSRSVKKANGDAGKRNKKASKSRVKKIREEEEEEEEEEEDDDDDDFEKDYNKENKEQRQNKGKPSNSANMKNKRQRSPSTSGGDGGKGGRRVEKKKKVLSLSDDDDFSFEE